jgi:hypothetical protein
MRRWRWPFLNNGIILALIKKGTSGPAEQDRLDWLFVRVVGVGVSPNVVSVVD